MARRGIDDAAEQWRRTLERFGNATKPKPKPKPVRVIKQTPAAKRRQQSIGVSSSSRQRTNKRGPHNR